MIALRAPRFRRGGLAAMAVAALLVFLPAGQAEAGFNLWTTNGPAGVLVDAIAVSPNFANDQTIFAGTESLVGLTGGGVFRSTNGGATWVETNAGLTDIAIDVDALIISPNFAADDTLFVSTGRRVFKSTNRGANWALANAGLPAADNIQTLAVASDGTLFAGTRTRGVFRSINGGLSWDPVNNGLGNADVESLAVSPQFSIDGTVFAGTRAGGLFRTTSGNTTSPVWARIETGLGAARTFGALAISSGFSSDGTVFAGSQREGVFRSVDRGLTWEAVNTGIPFDPDARSFPDIESLAGSPSFPQDRQVFAGTDTGRLFRSTDGGTSWSPLEAGLAPSTTVRALAVSPAFNVEGTVFAGTDRGVFINTIDTVSPTGSILLGGGAELTAGPTVTAQFSALDLVSGVTEMRFADSPAALEAAGFKPFAVSELVTLGGADGTKTIFAQFRDAAGNISPTASDTIVLDTTPPEGSLSIAGGTASTNSLDTTLNLAASDNLSGVVGMRFAESLAALQATSMRPFATTANFTLTGADGTKTVLAQFQDLAGNISAVISDDIVLSRPPAPVAPTTSTTQVTPAAQTASTQAAPALQALAPPSSIPAVQRPAPGVLQIARPAAGVTPLAPILQLTRVFILPNPFTPDGDKKNDFTRIVFTLDRPALVTLEVRSFRGVEKLLARNVRLPAGTFTIVWTGTDARGKVFPTGNYQLNLKAAAEGKQRTYSGIARVVSKVSWAAFFRRR